MKTTKRKTGPTPLPTKDRRWAAIVMLSANERKAMARVHKRVPFSTWARGVLVGATEDPSPVSDRPPKRAK